MQLDPARYALCGSTPYTLSFYPWTPMGKKRYTCVKRRRKEMPRVSVHICPDSGGSLDALIAVVVDLTSGHYL